MALTAENITSKKFDTKMRGYNQAEVGAFLNEVAATVAELTSQNRELQEEVRANEEKLKYFADLKDSLNKSILVAQEAADKVKNNAKKESTPIAEEQPSSQAPAPSNAVEPAAAKTVVIFPDGESK